MKQKNIINQNGTSLMCNPEKNGDTMEINGAPTLPFSWWLLILTKGDASDRLRSGCPQSGIAR